MAETSMNVRLPEALKAHVRQRVEEGSFSDPSDYVRALIRADIGRCERHLALKHDIELGLADFEAGNVRDGDDVIARLRARHVDSS